MRKLYALFIAVLLQLCVYAQTEIIRLNLKDAVSTGLQNNPAIKSARANILSSEGRYWSGISLPQPEIEITYDYAPVNRSLSNYSERSLAIKQSFEFPTIYFLKANKFSKEKNIALLKFKMSELYTISQIKTIYYKILAKQYQLNSAGENLKISDDFFKKAAVRQNLGEGTNLELLTAKVQFTEALNFLETAKNELAASFAELNFVLGSGEYGNATKYELTDSLVFTDYNINENYLLKSLEETNPHIITAKLNQEVTSVDKNLAWSSLLPNISLAYSRQSRDGDNGFYGASFGLSLPLWFMFEQKGKIQEAEANQLISASELQLTKNEETLKLKNAFTEYKNTLRQAGFYATDILPQAEEIYRTANKSYDAGELSYLEYLQAKQTLVNSRNSYISSLFSYYQSIFRIEEIIGSDITAKQELEK